jgi:predicted Fe-S protein YdhL (DUF1289 family)
MVTHFINMADCYMEYKNFTCRGCKQQSAGLAGWNAFLIHALKYNVCQTG